MNIAVARLSYDQLHYIGKSYLQTHPDWLAALGTLHGMRPTPPDRCRVLELACGTGSNLVPMAYALPESSFHGLDLSADQLVGGQQNAAALGLANLRLEALDLMDFPADAGQFDYIIAHGLYSWCPPAVRDRLLAVCAAHLAPQGIAFVSFNAYPGYHVKDLQRQLMLFHLAHVRTDSPAEQVRHALGVLDFVGRARPEGDAYGTMLRDSRETYHHHITSNGAAGLSWFHHDLLSDYNVPIYFHEFMDHAGSHGLQYVTDAVLRVPRAMNLTPEATQALQAMRDDVVTQEQYLDFLLGVPFRQVLLCRGDVVLDRAVGPAAMQGMFVAGNFVSKTVDEQAGETFSNPQDELTVKHPDARETLRQIGAAWPGAVSFEELLAHQTHGGTAGGLAEFLLQLCVGKFASFRVRRSKSALEISERPEASAVARLQARAGKLVTNLYHEAVELAVPARHLLGLLDGTRDRAELSRDMRDWITSGQAAEACQAASQGDAQSPEKSVPPGPSLDTLEADLDAGLRTVVALGLMVR